MQKIIRRNTLRKNQRLYGKKAIDILFERGRTFFAPPVKAIYIIETGLSEFENALPLRAAFSVPSKKFKRAVDRNLLKRRMREAFRKNKTALCTAAGSKHSSCIVMFIYTAQQLLPYKDIEIKIVVTLQHLEKKILSEKTADINH